jgi:hypothetical protein
MGATVVDVTERLGRRAAFKRAAKGEPMTKEEVRDWYIAQSPDEQARFSAFMRALAAKQDDRPAVVLTIVEGDGQEMGPPSR